MEFCKASQIIEDATEKNDEEFKRYSAAAIETNNTEGGGYEKTQKAFKPPYASFTES